jgi:hypothetical protein
MVSRRLRAYGTHARLATSAMVLLAQLACSEPMATQPLSATVGALAIPLEVGTEWIYESSDSLEFGQRSGLVSTFPVTVTKDTMIGSRRGVVLANGRIVTDGLLGPIAMMQTSQGVFTALTTSPYLPPTGSDAWQLRFPYPVRRGLRSLGWTVTSPDTVVTVPIGAVRAVRYDLSLQPSGESAMTVFVSPSLGIVYATRGFVREYDVNGTLKAQYRRVHRLVRVSTSPSSTPTASGTAP